MSVDRSITVRHYLEFAGPYLNDDAVTEIAIQRDGELWAERSGVWQCHAIPDIGFHHLNSLATAIAAYCDTDVSDVRPIMAAVLPTGERIQVVRAPVVEHGTISLTIRKPSIATFTMGSYKAAGFFSSIRGDAANDVAMSRIKQGDDAQLILSDAVATGKTIVLAGETGSGKTAFLRTLLDLIPTSKRVITIQDVHELTITHPNHVHLFYEPDGVTPTECLRSCLRMKPCRIIVGEIRGGEAMDVLNTAASGHQGTITSLHAASCGLALKRFALMAMQSEQGRALGYAELTALIDSVVDVVVHITNGPQGRHITDVWHRLGNS